MTQYLKLYTWLYLLVLVVLAVVFYLLERFLAIEPPGGTAGVLPPLIAAMQVGSRYAHDMGERPANATAWQGAFYMTGIAVVVNVVLLGVLLMLPQFRALFANLPPVFLIVIAVVLIGLVLLANRWGVMFGAKTALRAQEKAEGK